MTEEVRHYIDISLAALTALVALYYRVDAAKREAFEEKHPRIAAIIGMVAAVVPFIPMLIGEAKRLVTPSNPPVASRALTPSNGVPNAPWQEDGRE